MKEIVITGGNTGIGFETAKELACRGHRVTITARSSEKGRLAVDQIKKECGASVVDAVVVDLSDFDSIRKLAQELIVKCAQIDVLIHNAGTFHSVQRKNADGIELTFMVNHLAPFYLTHLLWPRLVKSNESRVIAVNSDSHYQARFDPDNLNLDQKFHGLRAYGRSKLANMLFTYEFERRNPYDNLSIYAVHPGLVKTDIGTKHTSLIHRLLWKLSSQRGKTPAQGADSSIYLATEKHDMLPSGNYWDKRQIKRSSKASYNEEHAEILWKESMRLCGVDSYFKYRQ